MRATVTSVTTLAGNIRRITFQVFPVTPGAAVLTPTLYAISLSGSAADGTAFASTNTALLTINPTASVSLLQPSIGRPGQSLSISIQGAYSNFFSGSTQASFGAGISVGGAPSGAPGPVTVTGPTTAIAQIVIDPAAVAGARTVSLQTGTEIATLPAGFSVVGAPSLIAVSPNTAPIGTQGITVTLNGQYTHFVQGNTAVSFGPGIALATPITVNSSTALTAVLNIDPGTTPGSRTVSVTTGGEAVALTNGFILTNGTPVLTGLTPSTGQQGQQGLAVAIAGQYTHFVQGTTTMSFGSGITLASPPVVNSSTSATAVINIDSAAVTGARTLIVTTGTESITLTNAFAITNGTPQITQISPNTGQQGQQNLTINLTGQFTHWAQAATTANFGTGVSLASPLTVASATSATAVLNLDSAAGLGVRSVILTTGTEVVTLTNGFTVVNGAPMLSQITPNSGRQGQQNLSVSIGGNYTHFVQGTTSVSFGSGISLASPLTVSSATGATAVLNVDPSTPTGPRTVTVSTGAEIITLNNGFVVTAGSPVITQVTPNTGQQGSTNLSVVITGQFTHFAQGTTVASFSAGITVVTTTVSSPTSATAILTVDPLATGTRNVTLTTGGEVVTLPNGFTIANGVPVITQVTPNNGQQGQQNLTVTVTGAYTHFAQGTTIASFGAGTTVTMLTVNSPTSAVALLNIDPATTVGTRNVTLTSGTEVVTQVNGFTIRSGTPVVTAVSPNFAQQGQALLASVSGQFTHFLQGATQLDFGAGVTASSISVTSPTALTAELCITAPTSAQWATLSPQGTGPALTGHTSVYRSAQKRMIVFGGFDAQGIVQNRVWVLTAADGYSGTPTWTEIQPIGPLPPGRTEHTAVFDASTDRMIVFGGINSTAEDRSKLTDVWVLTNASGLGGSPQWIQLSPVGSPGVANASAAVYDPTSNRMTLFAGCSATLGGCGWHAMVNEVWVLTNANGLGGTPTWIQLFPTGGPPIPRVSHTAAYDQTSNRMIVFGGAPNGPMSLPSDTWVLTNANGLGGSPQWIQLNPSTSTLGRYNNGSAYNSITKELIVTSGAVQTGGDYSQTYDNNDTWVLTGADGLSGTPFWIQISPPGPIPIPQENAKMVLDPCSNKLIFYGLASTAGAISWLTIDNPGATAGAKTVSATTNSETASLTSAFTVLGPGPGLISTTPSIGLQGQQGLIVTLTGLGTHFNQGITTADFGTGITVASVSVSSPSVALVTTNISSTAALGSRSVTLTTGTEVVSLTNGFTVTGTPAITQIAPNAAQQGQQSVSVTLTGQFTHLAQGTTIASFGTGITVASLTVSSATTAVALINIDALATAGPRVVTLTTGSETVSLINGFSVNQSAAPSITTVSPSAGPQGQGGPVTIVGLNTHFAQGTTQVDFGAGITVSNVAVTCPTCLSVQLQIAQTATTGPRTVTVTTGSEVVSLANGFTVQVGTPILTSLVPASGQQGQSFSVTLTGLYTHFAQGATQVSFGAGVTVSNISVSNGTSLTAQLAIDPAAAVGTRTPVVTTGIEVISQPNIFTVQAATPVLYSLSPGGGQQGQTSLPVTLTGQFTHWVQGTSQASFGTGVTVVSLTVSSATSAAAVVNIDPAATLGTRTVSMTTGTEVATFPNAFTVSAGSPAISLVSPNTAQPGQQNLAVVVTGQLTHFVQGTTSANFGAGVTVASLTVSSPTLATAHLNIDPAAGFGLRDVTFTSGGENAVLLGGFAINPGATITQINPANGQQGQQSLIVNLTGQNTHFVQGTTQANFGPGISVGGGTAGASGPVAVTSSTTASAQVSIAANATVGTRTVTVQTGSEQSSAPNAFLVQAVGAAISSVIPNSAPQGQQTLSVTVTGLSTHFVQGTTQVNFGVGTTTGTVAVTSATALTAQVSVASNAALGPRTVLVTTGPEQASLTNGFIIQSAVNQAPVITVAPTWSVTLPARLTINYTVTDDGLPLGGTLTQSWSTISGPGTVGYQGQTLTSVSVGFSQPGTYALRLTATDTQLTSSQDITVTVTGSSISPPSVSISSPADGTEITTAVTVNGSVGSSSLSKWVLEYQAPGSFSYSTLATGTTTVQNSTLGTFDPSILLNGIAYLRLTATDTVGQITTAGPVSLILTKNQKIGNFTVSFNDLSVPVAGLPIQVVRTYDSRQRSVLGDFGYGWTLDLKTARLSETVALGDQWNESHASGLAPYCISPAKAHTVTLSMPDGTTWEFQPTLSPQCQSAFAGPISEVMIGFAPVGATPPNASMAIAGTNVISVSGTSGNVSLLDTSTFAPFDPDQYNVTLPDGRTLLVSMSSGLQKMTDLSGNYLTVTATGIMHSSGKGVTLTRNAANQITKITDPAGNSINYGYALLSGDLTSVTDQANQTTTFTYNSDHALATIVDPRGVQPIRNDYDSSGRLIQHTDAFGKVISYTHNLSTRQEVVTDRLGNVTVNEYDTDGNIVTVTDALSGVTTRTYDSSGNMLTEKNPLGKVRSYTYDQYNNRLTEKDPLGNVTTYAYNSRNQVLTIRDAAGRVTTNVYDASGNLTSTKDPAGATTTYTYTQAGLRSSMTDALGGVTSYEYNAFGDLSKLTDALGNITTYLYDASGNKQSETKTRTVNGSPETLTTAYLYDALNRLVKTTYPDGSSTQISYNAIGKQATTTDQFGRQTAYTYDLMGRLTQTTYPDLTTDQATYDAEGHRSSSTDRGNRTTTYLYDALGRLTKTTYADAAVSSTTYDAIGQVSQTTDPRGNVTTYNYDDAGRRTKVTDALSHVTSFNYDSVGNQSSMTDANSVTTQYQYDNDNRRTKTLYADATSDSVAYDALGRTLSKTDQAGLTTQFQYDKLGRLTQVTDALSQVTKYTYDEVGNRLTQTDANNHTTSFVYDKLGRRTKRTLPLGGSETFTYDSAGNLKTKTDFNGKTTSYAYDQSNRLISKTPDASFGASPVSFTYTNSGQRKSMTDSSGTTTYTYDSRDRLTQRATPRGTLSYTYDFAGNLSSIRSSNTGGTTVDYTYDALNRLSNVKDNRLAAGVTTYTYDNVGNLQNYVYPNGVQTAYTFNALNRLTDLSITKSATLASYDYVLGPAGNRTQVTELGGRVVSYLYDSLYRLKSETITGAAVVGAIGYTCDAVGNRQQRTSTVAPVPAASYAYDANDRLVSDTYDANGNTTAWGSAAYTYDYENHLASQAGTTAVSIVYDGDGNRVAKTVGGTTASYLVDDRNLTGYAQVLEETSAGAVRRVYTYGLSRISESRASGASFYGYDGHGSVRILTDSTGAVTDRYDYDAFGNIVSQTGTTLNDFRYAGEQNDPSLGLYNLRARYYNSSTGRFQTTDPFDGTLLDPQSLHQYLYASASPIDKSDPSGQVTLAEEAAVVAIIAYLPTVYISYAWSSRVASTDAHISGYSLSVRYDYSAGFGSVGGGVDIAYDTATHNACGSLVGETGLSLPRAAGGIPSVSVGAYTGGNACDQGAPWYEHFSSSVTIPFTIGSIFARSLAPTYPFRGLLQRLTNFSNAKRATLSIGIYGTSGASVAVGCCSGAVGITGAFSSSPIPLSAIYPALQSQFGSAFAPGLQNSISSAVSTLQGLGTTTSALENNPAALLNPFSYFHLQ